MAEKSIDENPELTCVVSGSFKFKPEIDTLHEEFRDHNVLVVAPDTGWLYLPKHRIEVVSDSKSFRPLPTERSQDIKEIEDEFLRQMARADFVYIYDQAGYIGLSVAFEIGHALTLRKPIYASEAIDYETMDILELDWRQILEEATEVMSVEDTVRDFRAHHTD